MLRSRRTLLLQSPTARPRAGAGPLAALALLLFALGGCVTTTTTIPAQSAHADAVFPLLSPASYGASAQFDQVLHAAYGAQEASLMSRVAISPQRISVVGLTAMGQRIFTLDYDGTTLTAERSAFAPDRIQPAHILADLQLALWPLAALQAATAGSDWQVSEPRPGLRRLVRGELLVAEVHRADASRFWLSHLQRGYSIEIVTQEAPP